MMAPGLISCMFRSHSVRSLVTATLRRWRTCGRRFARSGPCSAAVADDAERGRPAGGETAGRADGAVAADLQRAEGPARVDPVLGVGRAQDDGPGARRTRPDPDAHARGPAPVEDQARAAPAPAHRHGERAVEAA